MRELALFAGGGGGLLGSCLLGWRTVGAVEIDPYCRSRLLDRQRDGCLPRFPIWDDVCTFDGRPWRGHVDVISGGFPCQDVSSAGSGLGIAGARSGLVFEMLRIVEEIRPRFVFAENSPQLRTKGLATIVERFIGMGYVGRVGVLGARHVGANHRRDRMWIVAVRADAARKQVGARGQSWGRFGLGFDPIYVADPNVINGGSGEGGTQGGDGVETDYGFEPIADSDSQRGLQSRGERPPFRQWVGDGLEQSPDAGITDWWSVPRFAGVDDGVADRLDRIRATGNGQVPGVAALVFRVLTADKETSC